jgi:hypothetical protein
MKKNVITNWAKYFAGVCAVSGMLLVTSCGDSNRENREADGAEYGMGVDPSASGGGVEGTEVEYASNNATQRNYDVNTMGTAAKNRRQMEATGKNLSDQDYQRLRQEYDQVNSQLRDNYRQSPGMSMRYTDDHQTADYSYEYYGVYYDNVSDDQTRNNFTQLEQRRMDLKNQMRGKIDKETGAYLAAEMDAVPKEGYDQLYNHLQSQMKQGQNTQASNAQGTVFVEFVVDKNGNVTNPKVVDVVEGQASAGNMSGAGTTGTTTGAAGTRGTGTNTGTGTSGEGTTDNATNTGMSPNSTGTVGSGNTAGSAGTTTGTTGNSTASGNDGAQAGQSGQAASTQTTQSAQNQTSTNTNATSGTTSTQGTSGKQGANSETAKQLEQQALKAIKSTSGMWEPAQMNGQPVASLVQMPIPVGMDNMGTSGQMNNTNMNNRDNTGGTNTNDRSNNGVPRNNNTGVEGGEGGTNVNPGSGTQNGGRTSTGTVNTGSGTASGTTDTDGGR